MSNLILRNRKNWRHLTIMLINLISFWLDGKTVNPLVFIPLNLKVIFNFNFFFKYVDIIFIMLKWLINLTTNIILGTEVHSTKENYTMPVLDTAYIRSAYRNKGFGSEILLDIIKRFPDEDIGFSKPISNVMLKCKEHDFSMLSFNTTIMCWIDIYIYVSFL